MHMLSIFPILVTIYEICLAGKTTEIFKKCYSQDKATEMVIFANLTDKHPRNFD